MTRFPYLRETIVITPYDFPVIALILIGSLLGVMVYYFKKIKNKEFVETDLDRKKKFQNMLSLFKGLIAITSSAVFYIIYRIIMILLTDN
ncbi:MAG: hypothetical protein GY909_07490 [Oligoflexia bacterium]|nr:hypothetical protein [Oligoflexia bacterium]